MKMGLSRGANQKVDEGKELEKLIPDWQVLSDWRAILMMYLPPANLINENLEGDILAFLSWDFAVKPVVEEVSRGSVVDETEDGKSDEALHVEWSSTDENLEKARREGVSVS